MLQPLSAYRGIQRVQLEVLHVVDKVHGGALEGATEDLALHSLLAGGKCGPRTKHATQSRVPTGVLPGMAQTKTQQAADGRCAMQTCR